MWFCSSAEENQRQFHQCAANVTLAMIRCFMKLSSLEDTVSNEIFTGRRGVHSRVRCICLWCIHMATAAFSKVRQHDSCPMTQVEGGGYKSFQAAVEKLPGDDGHNSDTASRTSLCQYGLNIRAGLFTSPRHSRTLERLMAAESPLIHLHSRLIKRASSQTKACTGRKWIWGLLRS